MEGLFLVYWPAAFGKYLFCVDYLWLRSCMDEVDPPSFSTAPWTWYKSCPYHSAQLGRRLLVLLPGFSYTLAKDQSALLL